MDAYAEEHEALLQRSSKKKKFAAGFRVFLVLVVLLWTLPFFKPYLFPDSDIAERLRMENVFQTADHGAGT